jgi:two-component system heavy metal sensor histidine kinase CusS
MTPACPEGRTCSHSIGRRLSRKLAVMTMAVLGILFAISWGSIKMLLVERSAEDMRARIELLREVIELEARSGGEPAVVRRVTADARMRPGTRLQLVFGDGTVCYSDPPTQAHHMSAHFREQPFEVALPDGRLLQARYAVDFGADARMGERWAIVLVLVTLAAGAFVAWAAGWHVRRQLRPLEALAAQTRAISAQRLDQRLSLDDPAEELLPWIEQFNALMQRLEQAYAQLEGFNADVAHELRTPLATLIGETELALSRERSAGSLKETLASNLEEMQRLSGMVNDMLFLASVDRGAVARRGEPVSLAALAHQVAEFHEVPLDEAGLRLEVQGDARLAVDEPLVKRALSNLLGNATRFAERGSTVRVRIADEAPNEVAIMVENRGQGIQTQALPRLFDRFFRQDSSRCCDGQGQHHGLGLAIVAAIARMHAGRTLAASQAGVTRVGFTLAAAE